MLAHLSVENLALVERIELEFVEGFNVLTGETGAGKSVLVGALSLVLGGRAQSDAVRTGAEQAVVEALFEVLPGGPLERRLAERGIEAPDGELLVRRVLTRSGRSRVLLNGQMATVGMLADIMRGEVDLVSQHEHVTLLDPETHLDILDAFGGHRALRAEVNALHAEVMGYRTALDAQQMDEAEKARREDYLAFALEEINAVDPKVGEIDELESERKRQRGFAELESGVREAEAALYSEDGAAVEIVGRVAHRLLRLADVDDAIAPMANAAASAQAELEELARSLSQHLRHLSSDPERLEQIEERLEALHRLARKHGGTVEAVLEARAAMTDELSSLEHDEARRADLMAALEAAAAAHEKKCRALSAARHKTIKSLEKAIEKELAALSMANTRFVVRLTPLETPGARGAESAEMLIAPNVGEPMKPLRKTASGGELSRVLLAIKHVLSERGGVGVYVFDEIDTGLGGAVAEVLGEKLSDVSKATQVLAVTHLAPVAAYADRHFRVAKSQDGARTTTRVEPLADGARVEELARMLGGARLTKATRKAAEELRERGVRPH
ncbi:MAG: DNA repair protein RecN [Deltaproteobacteria bacterium]|jgi:DNA repair protein RecN (Recombination protein N)